MTLRAALFAAAVALAAGGAQAAPAAFAPPHTSWGDPDLQGLWTNASLTRLERTPGINRRRSVTCIRASR